MSLSEARANPALARFRWVRGISLLVKLAALGAFLVILVTFGGHL